MNRSANADWGFKRVGLPASIRRRAFCGIPVRSMSDERFQFILLGIFVVVLGILFLVYLQTFAK